MTENAMTEVVGGTPTGQAPMVYITYMFSEVFVTG